MIFTDTSILMISCSPRYHYFHLIPFTLVSFTLIASHFPPQDAGTLREDAEEVQQREEENGALLPQEHRTAFPSALSPGITAICFKIKYQTPETQPLNLNRTI